MNEKQKQKQKTKKEKKKGKTYLSLEIASTPYTLSQKPPHPLSWSFCRRGKYVASRYFFLFLNNKKKKKKNLPVFVDMDVVVVISQRMSW